MNSEARRRWLPIGLLRLVAAVVCVGATACVGARGLIRNDPANAEYEIDGKRVLLNNGLAQAAAPLGSTSVPTTRMLGSPAFGDLDGDGDDDAVVWLLYQPGGSGSFYYVSAAINENGKFRGTKAAFVGDRIAAGVLMIERGEVIVHFEDRRPGAFMAQAPTEKSITRFKLHAGVLQPSGEGLSFKSGFQIQFYLT